MAGPFVVQIERGANIGTRFTLGPTATIGRQEGLEISLRDTQVSRQHARLEVRDERVVLTDLGAANGTFVNGERIGGAATLLPGDVIEVGETTLRLLGATFPQTRTVVAASPPVYSSPVTPDPQVMPAAHGAPPVVPARSSNRTPLLIGLGIAVVLLLCLCVAVVLALAASS